MEEWHQKLHNNTTPDDVIICEAYISFLESGGDTGAYWRRLTDGGITRQRLESFERPIVTDPEYYSSKRDALIRDFYNYLGILKAVHSGKCVCDVFVCLDHDAFPCWSLVTRGHMEPSLDNEIENSVQECDVSEMIPPTKHVIHVIALPYI